MPEFSYCQPKGRTTQLERFMSGADPDCHMMTHNGFVKKEKSLSVVDAFDRSFSASPDAKVLSHADRGFNEDMGTEAMFQGQSKKKSRAKESSKHFGVRFRPDLQKWVAEIRVAEWKTVDKKVWLGTFDSEEGAARAVDAARKLLKCKKKRPPNFHCESLTAYSEKIPANLNLNNLRDESMFKEVTLFVKRKAQEYAASFCPNKMSCISISSDQVLVKYNSQGLIGVQNDNIAMAELTSTSYESYNTQLSHVMAGDGQWIQSPTSVTYCSTPSCSSAGTSPEDDKWFHVDRSPAHMEPNVFYYRQELTQTGSESGPWVQITSSSQEVDPSWEGQNMGNDDHEYLMPENWWTADEVNELLFEIDDQEQCDAVEGQAAMDHEMLYVDSTNPASFSIVDTWMSGTLPLQQNFNTSYHSLMMNSIGDYTQVC